MSAHQQSQSQATHSSTTTTQTQQSQLPRLVLRAEPTDQRHITWAEDVVDNENLNKKSSKLCCIYHKPHSVDESSDESDSSESSDADSSNDDSSARPVKGSAAKKRRQKQHRHRPHDHDKDDACPGNHSDDSEGDDYGEGSSNGRSARRRSPNAYERVPKYNSKKAQPLTGENPSAS